MNTPERQITSAHAESASRRTMWLLSAYRSGLYERAPLRTATLAYDTSLTRGVPSSFLVLPQFMSIAEDFTLTMLLGVTESRLPSDPLVERLWEDIGNQARWTWGNLITSWGQWHGIGLTDFPEWNKVVGFREARNIVMHGLGRLTPAQLEAGKSLGRLEQAGIDVLGSEIVLTSDQVERCAGVIRKYVLWLDAAACEE